MNDVHFFREKSVLFGAAYLKSHKRSTSGPAPFKPKVQLQIFRTDVAPVFHANFYHLATKDGLEWTLERETFSELR